MRPFWTHALYTFIPAIKANAATKVAFKIFFFILFIVEKNNYYSYFHLIFGKNSTTEKAKLSLTYSDFYITFASDLTSFSFRREPQGGKNLIPAKRMIFLSIRFLLSVIYLKRIEHSIINSFYNNKPQIFFFLINYIEYFHITQSHTIS